MRKTIIAGNWKMFKTTAEALELVNGLKRQLFDIQPGSMDIVVCPAYTALQVVQDVLHGSIISLGAQDVFWQEEGAYTGEVSGAMLKDLGCAYCIIGHSERRQYFHETNETVNKKLNALFAKGITPIMCIGETLKEREAGSTFKVLDDHVVNGLKGFSADAMANIVLAYEPVWAIGTGKTATPAQAQEAHGYIRGILKKMFSAEIAGQVRIQYGGSVKPDNIVELMKQPDIDGALVGGASLKVESFSEIVKGALQVKK